MVFDQKLLEKALTKVIGDKLNAELKDFTKELKVLVKKLVKEEVDVLVKRT